MVQDFTVPPVPPPQPRRYVPATDAEFNTNVTMPSWADRTRAPGLDSKVTKKYYLTDEKGEYRVDSKGNPIEVSDSLLNIYEMFSQDWRLGNLTAAEVEYVIEHIDVAHDCLQSGYPTAALVVMERAISIVETSHSRGGWFRKILGTLRTENYHEMYEPKKNFWTGKKE